MPGKNEDLHGNAPDKCRVALLLIDVINDLEFPEGEQLFDSACEMAKKLAILATRARAAQVPVIYVNDNFGRWRSDLQAQVQHCLNDHVRGEPIVQQLTPTAEDYFILKPKHSAFFSTALEILLKYLGTETVIVTGIASNICVLFTANDAYMRDLTLYVPQDCVAANTRELNRYALDEMRTILKAEVSPSETIDFKSLR